MTSQPVSTFVTAPDGLRLHVREYGPRATARPVVVCLPGLTRTAADFDELATALAAKDYRVLALDYRGRGLSAWDASSANYSLPVELADLTAVLAAREAGRAVFVGSSRGGLLTMLLAATQPGSIAGVIFNDIGPVIEAKGLMRLKGYVGKIPQPRSFEEGAEILRRLFGHQFPSLSGEQWEAFARRNWRAENGGFAPTCDPKLADTLKGFDPEIAIPTMWPQFDALAAVPVMVVRGENSDILMPETVAAMRARRPDMTVLEIPGQGHTPLLAEDDTIAKLIAFTDGCAATRH